MTSSIERSEEYSCNLERFWEFITEEEEYQEGLGFSEITSPAPAPAISRWDEYKVLIVPAFLDMEFNWLIDVSFSSSLCQWFPYSVYATASHHSTPSRSTPISAIDSDLFCNPWKSLEPGTEISPCAIGIGIILNLNYNSDMNPPPKLCIPPPSGEGKKTWSPRSLERPGGSTSAGSTTELLQRYCAYALVKDTYSLTALSWRYSDSPSPVVRSR